MMLQEIDFSTLEIKEIGLWPLMLRIILLLVLAALILAAGYFYMWQDKWLLIDKQNIQEHQKRQELKHKYNLVANLAVYEQQMLAVNAMYARSLDELPVSAQLSELIEALANQAAANGLQYQSIKPDEATGMLDIVVTGNYIGFAEFISAISKMPRMLTIHEFSIKQIDVDSLVMHVRAKSYWLPENNELNIDLSTQEMPVIQQYNGEDYTGKNLRDPFAGNINNPIQVIVGTLQQGTEVWFLVRDPDGSVQAVKQNNRG